MFHLLQSEPGLRPSYHHQSSLIDGNHFTSALAYHLVDNQRIQLKAQGIT